MTMTTQRAKVRIDQATLTFAELADIEEQLGTSLSDVFEKSQARGMAALVWITLRRDDPTFTYEQALQYGPGDLEEMTPDPEVQGAATGATQQNSHANGTSTPQT
jgi:hypothetical protein